MKRIVIPGTFASMNEFIDANRRRHGSWSAGNAMKQRDQQLIAAHIRKQCRAALKEPIFIEFRYYCRNRKVDPDNISGYFHKVFLDALVKSGRIQNDGWKNVVGFCDYFFVDQDRARVEVDINEDMS